MVRCRVFGKIKLKYGVGQAFSIKPLALIDVKNVYSHERVLRLIGTWRNVSLFLMTDF